MSEYSSQRSRVPTLLQGRQSFSQEREKINLDRTPSRLVELRSNDILLSNRKNSSIPDSSFAPSLSYDLHDFTHGEIKNKVPNKLPLPPLTRHVSSSCVYPLNHSQSPQTHTGSNFRERSESLHKPRKNSNHVISFTDANDSAYKLFSVTLWSPYGRVFLSVTNPVKAASKTENTSWPVALSFFHLCTADLPKFHPASTLDNRTMQVASALHVIPVMSVLLNEGVIDESTFMTKSPNLSVETPCFICLATQTINKEELCLLRQASANSLVFQNVNISKFVCKAQEQLNESLLIESESDLHSSSVSSSSEKQDHHSTNNQIDRALSKTMSRLCATEIRDCVWVIQLDVDPSEAKTHKLMSTQQEDTGVHLVDLRQDRYRIRDIGGRYLTLVKSSQRINKFDLDYFLELQEYPCESGAQTWCFNNAKKPFEPLWTDNYSLLLQCPNIHLELCSDAFYKRNIFRELGTPSLSLELQEKLLLEDLLYVFFGVPGEFIQMIYMDDETEAAGRAPICNECNTPLETKFSSNLDTTHEISRNILQSTSSDSALSFFFIQEQEFFDAAVIEMTYKILSLARIQRKIARFVEIHSNFIFGLCSQALVEAIRQLLKEFLLCISELELQNFTGKLTIRKFWYYIQSTAPSFETLEKVVDATLYKKGGHLLNGLLQTIEYLSKTNPSCQLCRQLLKKASLPFNDMLKHWITEGIINDLHNEFFIVENTELTLPTSLYVQNNKLDNMFLDKNSKLAAVSNHPYWALKFFIQPELVPFTIKPLAQQILETGKHVHILRLCNTQRSFDKTDAIECVQFKQLDLDLLDPQNFNVVINVAKTFSQRLVHYLITECDLNKKFLSIHRFMFFSRSDMFFNFLSLLEEEMKTNSTSATVSNRLHSTFELAVNTSSLILDPYRNSFRCVVSNCSVREISRWFHPFKSLNEPPTDSYDWILAKSATLSPTEKNLKSFQRLILADVSDSTIESGIGGLSSSEAQNRNDKNTPGSIKDIGKHLIPAEVTSPTHLPLLERFQELGKYLTFSFSFEWPLQLIFTPSCLLKYQLLSRLIIQFKLVEKKLSELWQVQIQAKDFRRISKAAKYQTLVVSYNIRIRILHFVQNFIFYITSEVLQPRFRQFYEKLQYTVSVGEIMTLQHQFLDTCLVETFLTDDEILRSLAKVLTVCQLYTNTALKFGSYCLETLALANKIKEKVSEPIVASNLMPVNKCFSPVVRESSTLMSEEKFGEIIQQYATHFNKNIRELLTLLISKSQANSSCASCIYNLLNRLDFNRFYSRLFQLDLSHCNILEYAGN